MPDFENKLMPPKIIEKVRKQSRKNKLRLCEGQNPQIKEVFKFCFQSSEIFLVSEAVVWGFFNCLLILSPPASASPTFAMGRTEIKLPK